VSFSLDGFCGRGAPGLDLTVNSIRPIVRWRQPTLGITAAILFALAACVVVVGVSRLASALQSRTLLPMQAVEER
jgi:hypothetical protein